MARVTVSDLSAALEKLQAQMSELLARMERLENPDRGAIAIGIAAPAPAMAPPAAVPPVAAEPEPTGIAEEELLAISAAIGAYLGVRAHIRQIRLLGSNAWAQQGRVSIQASHSLQG
jgi:methylmalonyl-CoA carboxyltransferase large subunit